MIPRPFTILAVCLLPSLSSPVNALDLNFCWVGAGGYTMTGSMQIPDEKMTNAIITEADVTRFKIVGYQDGAAIGAWSMREQKADTTWHLRFDPISLTFLTGGAFATTRSQGWNANGDVTDCGPSGFGFNSGNYAQDICLNGVYVHQSSVPPETPLTAAPNAVDPTCGQRVPLSKR